MSDDIHIAITRRVRPEHVEEFERLLTDFASRSIAESGTRGMHFVKPPPGSTSTEYGILHSFANQKERDAFYKTPLYLEWQKNIVELTEGEPIYRQLNGLEAWFRSPQESLPPRWKMAVATLAGVYPTSYILSLLLGPHIKGHPHFLATLIMSLGMVLCLTWLVMPFVTQVLHSWLHPKRTTTDAPPL